MPLPASPAPAAPLSPTQTPISDYVQGQLATALGKVPDGKQGTVQATASLQGAEVSLGWRLSDRWTASAWYGRTWAGAQDGGARATFTW